jgi:hypothetical protein
LPLPWQTEIMNGKTKGNMYIFIYVYIYIYIYICMNIYIHIYVGALDPAKFILLIHDFTGDFATWNEEVGGGRIGESINDDSIEKDPSSHKQPIQVYKCICIQLFLYA